MSANRLWDINCDKKRRGFGLLTSEDVRVGDVSSARVYLAICIDKQVLPSRIVIDQEDNLPETAYRHSTSTNLKGDRAQYPKRALLHRRLLQGYERSTWILFSYGITRRTHAIPSKSRLPLILHLFLSTRDQYASTLYILKVYDILRVRYWQGDDENGSSGHLDAGNSSLLVVQNSLASLGGGWPHNKKIYRYLGKSRNLDTVGSDLNFLSPDLFLTFSWLHISMYYQGKGTTLGLLAISLFAIALGDGYYCTISVSIEKYLTSCRAIFMSKQ